MGFARFFIDRPIFAGVISIVIVLAGALAIVELPVSEYPEVVPPTVQVLATYPGASPSVLAATVATPLEEQINGADNMLYMASQAQPNGNLTITVTFRIGTNPDIAQVQVQNRVSQALPRLPEEVRTLGVTTQKTSPDLMMAVALMSPDHRYDALYLRNYAILQVKDVLNRLPGIGQIVVFGAGITRCGSGSTRCVWPTAGSCPATSSARSVSKTCRSPRERSAVSRSIAPEPFSSS
jgi:multidrug efflux pump subunit AcrB